MILYMQACVGSNLIVVRPSWFGGKKEQETMITKVMTITQLATKLVKFWPDQPDCFLRGPDMCVL